MDVEMVRDNPNLLHLLITNRGPGTATNVKPRFPDREPILTSLDVDKPHPLLAPGKVHRLYFRQFLEHPFQAVYAVELYWQERGRERRKLFYLSFPLM